MRLTDDFCNNFIPAQANVPESVMFQNPQGKRQQYTGMWGKNRSLFLDSYTLNFIAFFCHMGEKPWKIGKNFT